MALTDIQFSNILSTLGGKLKKASATRRDEYQELYKLADWGELYKKACEHSDEIEVHACGDFPEKLIGANFPGETNEEKNYRKKSYQPITKPYWHKAMRTISRVWAEQNYTIDWTDENVKKYFMQEYPIGNNVLSFFKSIVTNYKIKEPNGVLAIDFELPVRETAEGELVIDDTKEIAPYATVYDADDVLMYESNVYALLMSDETSMVEFGGKQQQIGYVLYLYDNMGMYRVKQVGKKLDWTFEAELYYMHSLNLLPVWKLKGVPTDVICDEQYYESYFAPALPHLNEAVIIQSTNKSVRNKVCYPIRVYYEQTCNADGCNNGYVYKDDAHPHEKCSACKGTGKVAFSPFRDYVHEAPTATNQADGIAFPGIGYVSPDGAIIKDNDAVIKDNLETAFLFLNIDVMQGQQKGLNDPTATKSKIDRDEQYISMLDISNELFLLLHQFLNAAYQVRYNKESPIAINAPTTFDLVSSDELRQSISQSKQAGITDIALSQMTLQLMEQDFPQSVSRKAVIAQYCDALFVKDITDIPILLANKLIYTWQALLHVNFDVYLNELLEKEEGFMDYELPKIKEQLINRAKEDETALTNTSNNAGDILRRMGANA